MMAARKKIQTFMPLNMTNAKVFVDVTELTKSLKMLMLQEILALRDFLQFFST